MADDFVIEGTDETSLTLKEGERGSHWVAVLVHPQVQAESRFYERFSGTRLGIGAYFRTLAEQWRGWEGPIEFEAMNLTLAAAHDGLGHVTLGVKLDRWGDPPQTWAVNANVVVDAGALDRLAAAAQTFDEESGTDELWYGWPPPEPHRV